MLKIYIAFIALFFNLFFVFSGIACDITNFPTPNSEFIETVFYQDNNKTLIIDFKNKKRYVYYNVDRNIFCKFYASSSKGRFFNKHIRNVYEYKRLK